MIIDITAYDGYIFKGRLSLPDGDGEISKLVIAIDGAGPNTYDNGFRIPAALFTGKGIAYFTFNKRGIEVTDKPPFYTINHEEYKKYLPLNSIEDIYSIIKALKKMKRLTNCKVFLNGCSEGATLAPLFASKYPNMVDALLLCGYSNVNMKDMQIWQCSKIEGGSAMLDECFNAVERKDNEWLMSRMGLTAEWFSESYNLKSNSDLLPTLELPIYIFHGALDNFCDIQGVYKIRDTFAQLGKTNLITLIFDNHGHGLEVSDCSDDKTSDGIKSLLNTIYNF